MTDSAIEMIAETTRSEPGRHQPTGVFQGTQRHAHCFQGDILRVHAVIVDRRQYQAPAAQQDSVSFVRSEPDVELTPCRFWLDLLQTTAYTGYYISTAIGMMVSPHIEHVQAHLL